MALQLNNFEFPLPKNIQFQVKLKLAKRFLTRRFSKVICIFFTLLLFSPLRKKAKPIILPKDVLGRNWPSGSEVEDFQKLSIFFHFVAIISPTKKDKALYLNETNTPLPKDFFCAKFSWHWPDGSGEVNICEQIWMDTWTDRKTINYRFLQNSLEHHRWANAC